MTESRIDGSLNPHAVEVVSVAEDGKTLVLNEAELHRIILQVKDLPIVVVAVAGKYRQGKSFLLSLFLRYLLAQENGNAEDWLGNNDIVNKSFYWGGGPWSVTSGIQIWSKPIVVKTPKGKVAVVLMDTQGTKSTNNSFMDVPVFALGTLLSSVLVFNLKEADESDMNNLHLFMEYAKMASPRKENCRKPFQILQFLIRDWNSVSSTYRYGGVGGAAYIKDLLDSFYDVPDLRVRLNAAFSAMECFLMPHPGLLVDSYAFTGSINVIENEFMNQLRVFVPMLLSSANLVCKEDPLGGRMTGEGWCSHFKKHFEFFKEGRCPQAITIFEAHNISSYENALELALIYLDFKTKHFEKKITNNIRTNPELKLILENTRKIFENEPKLSETAEKDAKYWKILEERIEKKIEIIRDWTKRNKKNRIFKIIRNVGGALAGIVVAGGIGIGGAVAGGALAIGEAAVVAAVAAVGPGLVGFGLLAYRGFASYMIGNERNAYPLVSSDAADTSHETAELSMDKKNK